ncbi:MAG TPA: hypothetical protein VF824_04240 [Thermoanaerobaculia bacterium]|jgi:hypothetical protein
MHRRIAVAVAVLFCAVSAAARDPYTLSVWVRNNSTSVATFNNNNGGNTITEVNPVWYSMTDPNLGPVRIVQASIVPGLNSSGMQLVPVIQNIVNGNWSVAATNWILANPDQHAADIKALLDAHPEYAGIELDYESMLSDTTDPAVMDARRDLFTSLVQKIKAQIGTRKLSVCVYRKRDLNGTRDAKTARIFDYAGLTGPYAADEIKIMMYSDISSTSNELVKNTAYREALTFADAQVVNHNKIVVALPWYGYNLTTRVEGTAAADYCCESRNASGELLYNDSAGNQWVVMDEQATRTKILIALNEFDVGGFAFWEAGRIVNFPGVWETIRGKINNGGATVNPINPPFCPAMPYQVYIDWGTTVIPAGASYRFDWYQWGFNTGNYTWKATGDPSSPGLNGGSYFVRVHGVSGRRVYEAESQNMFTLTCVMHP